MDRTKNSWGELKRIYNRVKYHFELVVLNKYILYIGGMCCGWYSIITTRVRKY